MKIEDLNEGLIKIPKDLFNDMVDYTYMAAASLIETFMNSSDKDKHSFSYVSSFDDMGSFSESELDQLSKKRHPIEFMNMIERDFKKRYRVPDMYGKSPSDGFQSCILTFEVSKDVKHDGYHSKEGNEIRVNLDFIGRMGWRATPDNIRHQIKRILRHELTHLVQYAFFSKVDPRQVDDSGDYYNREVEFDPWIKTILDDTLIKFLGEYKHRYINLKKGASDHDIDYVLSLIKDHTAINKWKGTHKHRVAMKKITAEVFRIIKIHNEKVKLSWDDDW